MQDNSQPCSAPPVKMTALVGKEWGPMSWRGDLWEDCGEAGDTEPLNPDESPCQ